MRVKKLAANKRQKQGEYGAFLKTLPPAFVSYAKAIKLGVMPPNELARCSERFGTLKVALDARDIQLRTDSRLCEEYITSGAGMVGAIVDTMEEMAFLYKHTSYSERCRDNIEAFRENLLDWYPRDEYNYMIQSCREDAKAELCVEYLLDSNGLTLPRKWERCQPRFDALQTAGKNLKAKARYIYVVPASDLMSPDY